MRRLLVRVVVTSLVAVGGGAAVDLAPSVGARATAATPPRCVAPVAGRCQLAGTGWVFAYSCTVGTCGYGYSFAAHHVAYGQRGAVGTWRHVRGTRHGITMSFATSAGPDDFVATLDPHTGTGSGTETYAGGTFPFTATENPA